MSRRNVLEDSDSEDNPGGTAAGISASANTTFFSAEEHLAINICNIQVNNGGRFSNECMQSAIASIGEPPFELLPQEGGDDRPQYQKYRVKKGEEKAYFKRDIYQVHHTSSGEQEVKAGPTEEAILLEIEALRRSEKAVKNEMFKSKAGSILFGAWWNYILVRVIGISSNKNLSEESFAEYTAIKIIRALFSFICEDLGVKVIKPGKVSKLSKFDVDWIKASQTARNVINHMGGTSHFLHKEVMALVDYVELLNDEVKWNKAKENDPETESLEREQAEKVEAVKKSTRAVDEKKAEADKRAAASKARKAKMEADLKARRDSLKVQSISPGKKPENIKPPPAAQAFRYALPHGHDRKLPIVSKPAASSYASMAPQAIASLSASMPKATTAAASAPTSNSTSNQTQSSTVDEGWGKTRKGPDTIQPYKSMQPPTQEYSSMNRDNSGHSVSGGQSRGRDDDNRDNRNAYSYRDNNRYDSSSAGGGQSRSREYDSRDNRNSEYSSRDGNRHEYDPNRPSGRYDKSSDQDHGSKGEDYKYSDSRGRDDYASRTSKSGYREDYNDRKPPHRSRNDSGGSGGYAQMGAAKRQDRDDTVVRPQKRFRTEGATAPPVAAAPHTGRGTGVVNKPEWMTEQERGGAPTVLHGNNSVTSNPASGLVREMQSTNTTSIPPAASIPSTAGRGRGAHVNKPAWMMEQERMGLPPPSNTGTNPTPSMGGSTNYAPAPLATSLPAGGRGRGAHVNQPAWMTRGQASKESNAIAGADAPIQQQQQYAPPQMSRSAFPNDGQGKGRGRGRDMNLPAWMTKGQAS